MTCPYIFVVAGCKHWGHIHKNGVASCHLDDKTGNDMNTIIRKFSKKTLNKIKELTSEFNSTVYGGSYYLN